MGLQHEAELYISNKKGINPNPNQIKRLVKTIYKNLVKQNDVSIDVDWVRDVVFGESIETGVGLMYTRLERVNALIEKFTEKIE